VDWNNGGIVPIADRDANLLGGFMIAGIVSMVPLVNDETESDLRILLRAWLACMVGRVSSRSVAS